MNDVLYQAHILDHAQHPRNKAEMLEPDVVVPAKNPSCGDSLVLYLKLNDGTIAEATFSGVGCALSQAAASLLTEKITGKTLADALQLTEADVYALLHVEVTAGRQKCALLAWRALMEAQN
jgi:nitrogen fixation NifU-like protein